MGNSEAQDPAESLGPLTDEPSSCRISDQIPPDPMCNPYTHWLRNKEAFTEKPPNVEIPYACNLEHEYLRHGGWRTELVRIRNLPFKDEAYAIAESVSQGFPSNQTLSSLTAECQRLFAIDKEIADFVREKEEERKADEKFWDNECALMLAMGS